MKFELKNILKFSLSVFFILFFIGISTASEEKKITKIGLWAGKTKLRGVNIYQRRVYPELDGDLLGDKIIGPEYTLNDFLKLRSLGVNYVNLSCPGIFSEKPPYILDKEVLDYLDNLINIIKQADMFVVISFRTGPGRSEFTFFYGEDYESDPDNGWFDKSYYNDKVWESRKAQKGWANMWRYTAEHFKNNPIVVGYDLMVEPNSNDVCLDIWEPEEFYEQYGGSTYDWNSFFPEIVKAIREKDTETPVIIQGLSYADLYWINYVKIIDDEKAVYSAHQYEPFVYTHQSKYANKTYPGFYDIDYDGVPDNFNKKWFIKYLEILKKFKDKNSLIVTSNEFGGVRWAPSIANFIDDEISFFEKLEANYAIWMWYPSSWCKPPISELFSAFNFLFGPDPENLIEMDNDYKNTLIKYWNLNKYYPSNVKIISSHKKKGIIRR